MTESTPSVTSRIEHTLLRADAAADDIQTLCRDAVHYGFAGVCLPPAHLSQAVNLLEGSNVLAVTVAGFPFGFSFGDARLKEVEIACSRGANEIDLVAPVWAVKGGLWEDVKHDLTEAAQMCSGYGVTLKVILETCLLSDGEKEQACRAAMEAGAAFVKTSTGFGPGGATVDDVALLARCTEGSAVRIKAAGGIRTLKQARELITAGAARIGTSSGVAIAREERELHQS